MYGTILSLRMIMLLTYFVQQEDGWGLLGCQPGSRLPERPCLKGLSRERKRENRMPDGFL